MKNRKIFMIMSICSLFLFASNANCRNYLKDTYSYEENCICIKNDEAGIEKTYERQEGKKGIDVSKWQGEIDWESVANSGVEFAIIRDGYGKKFAKQVDKYFNKNMENASKNGIKCGVYHYSYAENEDDSVAEAYFCLENIKNYKFEYPVFFDIEDEKLCKIGKEKLTNICYAFCNKLRENGYYVSIYTNLHWVKNFLLSEKLFKGYDLWLARYNSSEPGYNCGMWQYTNKSKIKGISTNVDEDIVYFDYPKIIKELNFNGF